MRNKKIIQFFIYTLIFIIVLEYFSYRKYVDNVGSVNNFIYGKTKINAIPLWSKLREQSHIKRHSKKPVLFFGCSYTYGFKLSDEETLPYLVEKATNRYCYNFGLSGYNISEALLLFDNVIENIEPPEYIIYTYMFDHLQRNGQWYNFDSYRKRNLIPQQSYNFLYKFWTVQYIKNTEFSKFLWGLSFKENIDFFFNVVENVKKECDKKFPDSKFIVLLYSDVNQDLSKNFKYDEQENRERIDKSFEFLYSKEIRKRFENLGISVISTEDLIGRKMDRVQDRVQDDEERPHPSASAWKAVVPALVRYLNL